MVPIVERADGRDAASRDAASRDAGDRSAWCFAVDVNHGHKTGFYLDQRDSRRAVAALAEGRRVLDVFAYSGGFSVAAAQGGAVSVTAVDSSGPALALAARNLAANGLAGGHAGRGRRLP